jgi:hypothetical protein
MVSHRGRSCGGSVLLADALEFFFVFHGTHIIHAAQFVELPESQACFAQVIFGDLAVVGREILIGLGFFLIEFFQQHRDIYAAAGAAAAGAPAPDAGRTPPGGAAPGAGGAPASAPASRPANS